MLYHHAETVVRRLQRVHIHLNGLQLAGVSASPNVKEGVIPAAVKANLHPQPLQLKGEQLGWGKKAAQPRGFSPSELQV